jgi:hypothetical protein
MLFIFRHPKLIESAHIQHQICNGLDVYNFLPEAFTFKNLFIQILSGAQQVDSFWDIPWWPVKNPERFDWILPGGNCTRDE